MGLTYREVFCRAKVERGGGQFISYMGHKRRNSGWGSMSSRSLIELGVPPALS